MNRIRSVAGIRAVALDRDAVRDAWPVLLGILPFGLLTGVTIAHSRVGAGLGLGSAALFFGGSAHLAALALLETGAGPVAVLACVVVVNARLALHGAALHMVAAMLVMAAAGAVS